MLAEGDEVLILLPTTTNKLTMQWKGRYRVTKSHQNGVDYLIKVGNKVKLYHINMLKKYIRREDDSDDKSVVCQAFLIDDTEVPCDACDVVINYPVQSKH